MAIHHGQRAGRRAVQTDDTPDFITGGVQEPFSPIRQPAFRLLKQCRAAGLRSGFLRRRAAGQAVRADCQKQRQRRKTLFHQVPVSLYLE